MRHDTVSKRDLLINNYKHTIFQGLVIINDLNILVLR